MDGAHKSVALYLKLFPDLQFVVHEQVTEGDRVASRWTLHGTHRGRRVRLWGIVISRLDDGGQSSRTGRLATPSTSSASWAFGGRCCLSPSTAACCAADLGDNSLVTYRESAPPGGGVVIALATRAPRRGWNSSASELPVRSSRSTRERSALPPRFRSPGPSRIGAPRRLDDLPSR